MALARLQGSWDIHWRQMLSLGATVIFWGPRVMGRGWLVLCAKQNTKKDRWSSNTVRDEMLHRLTPSTAKEGPVLYFLYHSVSQILGWAQSHFVRPSSSFTLSSEGGKREKKPPFKDLGSVNISTF